MNILTKRAQIHQDARRQRSVFRGRIPVFRSLAARFLSRKKVIGPESRPVELRRQKAKVGRKLAMQRNMYKVRVHSGLRFNCRGVTE